MGEIIKLDKDSELKYYENFLSENDQNKLIKELKSKIPWTHGVYNMFGKPIKTPRLLYAMKDKDDDITDSYKVTDSIPWTKEMKKLKTSIEDEIGLTIRYAQLNFYRNGDDYIGFHTDSEVREGDLIASISLGDTRKFTFMNREDKKNKKSFDLVGGSLLVMDENSAKLKWKHALPKMKNVEERINITFRIR